MKIPIILGTALLFVSIPTKLPSTTLTRPISGKDGAKDVYAVAGSRCPK